MPATMADIRNRNEPQMVIAASDYRDSDEYVVSLSARVFGYLAETAGPILEHYHSDLYHDARIIEQMVADWDSEMPLEFFWSLNNTGTSLSRTVISNPREYMFKCALWEEKRNYGSVVLFTMERVR
jgi:hypothetical protein